jgi:phosphoribosyl 1,2-cyclic phosphodiesterase
MQPALDLLLLYDASCLINRRVRQSFQILGSSSAGNSGLLRTEHSTVLIDAGFSARQITAMLSQAGVDLAQLDAVFLTHEHNDHAAGIRGLAKHANLPIFANRPTAEAIQSKLKARPNWHVFETGTHFQFRDLAIHPFAVPHDAYDPVGFTFAWGEDDLFSKRHSLAWITDLGYVPKLVREIAESVEFLFIESNYDESLLESDTRRPWSTKQRIRSRHGHLSNRDCHELIENFSPCARLRHIWLGHLSRDCNTFDIVNGLVGQLARSSGRFTATVVDPNKRMDTLHDFQKS